MWWYVYMVRCRDESLYTGATNDLPKRLAAHNSGKGARYTRARGPVEMVWKRRVSGRGAALSLEYRIKQMTRAEKLRLAQAGKYVILHERQLPRQHIKR